MHASPSLASRFHKLFRSHPNVHGRTDVVEGFDENGKAMSRSWLCKENLTEEVWSHHLTGARSIGCVPIKPNNTVSWGAIDVDLYNGTFDFDGLRQKITAASLPFVVCRSKSGGGHIYLFLDKEILAKEMVAKLEQFAAYFGQGSSEIFPKQIKLGRDENDTDYGNWLNMPYNGPESLRYATDDGGNALDAAAFIEYANSRVLSATAFRDLSVPAAGEILPNGPPCLNYIFAERSQENDSRNTTLSNVAVYLKKAFGEAWADHLQKYNQMFAEPLGDREVEGIKKSYARKEYRYQCSKTPLCSYCNARVCKQRTYGIGKDEIVPSNRSLTKLDTDPPIWYLDINDKRIQLTTEQLFNFNQFNKRCLEVLNMVFQPYKQAEWLENLAGIAQNCSVIEVEDELSERGILHEILSDFTGNAKEDDPECLRRGVPYATNEHVLFRARDLKSRLERDGFRTMDFTSITALLKQKYEGRMYVQKVANSTIYCWKLPRSLFQAPEVLEPTVNHQPEPF